MRVTVNDLMKEQFTTRHLEEKVLIVTNGKPRPIRFSVTQKDGTPVNLSIDPALYDRYEWLTVCDTTGYFFCWPCVLCGVKDPLWKVYSSHLPARVAENHLKNQRHVTAIQLLESFKEAYVKKPLPDRAGQLYRQLCNNNASALRVLIDTVCEVTRSAPLQTITETSNKVDWEDCVRLLQLASDCCGRKGRATEEAVQLLRSNPKVLDDLTEAIMKTLEERFKAEMKASTFVALILTEHSTNRDHSHLSLVARYVAGGKVCERLLGFLSILVNKSKDVLYDILLAMLKRFDILRKVVSFSFSGGILTPFELCELKKRLVLTQLHCPFVPCHYHDLYSLLQLSLSSHTSLRCFFKVMAAMEACFGPGSRHWKAIEASLLRKDPSLASLRGWPDVPLLLLLHDHRAVFVEYATHVCQSPSYMFHPEDVIKARGFNAFLYRFETVFFVHFVWELLQTKTLSEFDATMRSECPELGFDRIVLPYHVYLGCCLTFEKVAESAIRDYTGSKAAEFPPISQSDDLRYTFKEVLKQLREELKVRYSEITKLEFLCLLQSEYYARGVAVPKRTLEEYLTFIKVNIKTFDVELLGNEISVLQNSSDLLHGKDAFESLALLSDPGYRKVFSQTLRLFEYGLTLPFRPPRGQAAKSKRIRKLKVGGIIPKGETSVLGIEGEFVASVRNEDCFYKSVISHLFES